MNKFRFEKYTSDDFELYFDLVKEDDVMKFIWGRGMTDLEARKKFDFILDLNSVKKDLGYYKVFEDEKHIGDCKLVNYRLDLEVFELGYLLKQNYWGKGIGSLICKEMLNLAEELDAKKDVVAIIHPKNTGSRKILEKFGFTTYFIGTENEQETEKLRLVRR